jgi:hypothetical protein
MVGTAGLSNAPRVCGTSLGYGQRSCMTTAAMCVAPSWRAPMRSRYADLIPLLGLVAGVWLGWIVGFLLWW